MELRQVLRGKTAKERRVSGDGLRLAWNRNRGKERTRIGGSREEGNSGDRRKRWENFEGKAGSRGVKDDQGLAKSCGVGERIKVLDRWSIDI